MKVALVHSENSFCKEWITYLNSHGINYFEVEPYANDVIQKILKADYFFWHFDHLDYKDALCARQIIFSVQNKVKCFPNLNECFYFDDKIGQKHILESLKVPVPQTRIFYDKKSAECFINKAVFPLVAKLRKGAGSSNVWLLKNKADAKNYIKRAFDKGFTVFNKKDYLNARYKRQGISGNIKGRVKILHNKKTSYFPREMGYTLFQQYIKNEGFDIRIVVINNEKAFSAKRYAQEDGWTASGSGIATYPNESLDTAYVKQAFFIAEQLNTRCVAIDFIKQRETAKIFTVEISPLYASYSMKPCTGYWDHHLNWHNDNRDPQWFLIDKMINN